MNIKKGLVLSALILSLNASVQTTAQTTSTETTYRRPSLCQFLVSRTDQNMHDRIEEQYLALPTPDQYNDHNLSIRVINVGKKAQYKDSINSWLDNNFIASRLVGKWFDRDILTGQCSMNLIKSRGLYNATEFDKELASRSVRGNAMLEDAGEDLIGNTFVLVHEAHYIDNAKRSENVATGLRIGGALLGALLRVDISDLTDNIADLTETFKGFRVKFHTTLYRLEWNDEVAGTFYQQMYSNASDSEKKDFFERNRNLFKLVYTGEVESSGSQNSFLGISEEHPEIMIRKACCRAIDDNIADLQHRFEQFRVKSPISSIRDSEIDIAIGMKEGLTPQSEYEILEPEEKGGKIKYNRIGVIVPVAGKIMDNRYMAYEEGALGADLKVSTFKLKSGKMPNIGNFVRQIK